MGKLYFNEAFNRVGRVHKLKKQRVLLAAAAVLLLVSTTAHAAGQAIKAALFQSKIIVNNKLKELSSETTLLNYNNRVYVPLRAFASILGSAVGYDADNKTIFVDQPNSWPVKSELHGATEKEGLEIKILSEKAVYAYGEPIRIWARLSNASAQEITLYLASPLVGFNIKDKDGFESNQWYALDLHTSKFKPGDEYSSILSPRQFLAYNAYKQGIYDFDQYSDKTARPAALPKGEYTIEAVADYSLSREKNDSARRSLKASVKITVN